MSRQGYDAQQYDGHVSPDRRDNVMQPVDDEGILARMATSTVAHRESLQVQADRHREWIVLAGAAAGLWGMSSSTTGATAPRPGGPFAGFAGSPGIGVAGEPASGEVGIESESDGSSRKLMQHERNGHGSGRGMAPPGKPGATARWAAGPKDGVGTALSTARSVWFTLGHGILTEIFYPFVDTACTRDLGLLVCDRRDFFSEEQHDTYSQVEYLKRGVPAFRLTNVCQEGRYAFEKEVLADPRRSVVLQQIFVSAAKG